ncbi:MAG: FimV/HubP family polar landmark protein, partial [Lysobacterales bacterium]
IVQEGDTLSAIAYRLASEQRVLTNQMMLALQRDNTDAFFADNINALKAGAVLRVPENDRIHALARAEADQEVRRQLDVWAGVDSTPALADPGRAPMAEATTAASPATPAQARVELLSPRQEGEPGGSTPGASSSQTGEAEMAAVQADLNRAREELSSREREVAELSSRVQDLEEINSQNSRLLELKDTEVAALQRRLADLSQAAEAAEAEAAAVAGAADADADQAVADMIAALAAAEETDTDAMAGSEADVDGTQVTDDASDLTMDGEALAQSDDQIDEADTAGEGADAIDDAAWAAAATGTSPDPFTDPSGAPEGGEDSWAAVDAAPGVAETPAVAEPIAIDATPAAESSLVQAPAADGQAVPFYQNPLLMGTGLVVIAVLLLLALLSRRQRERAVATPAAVDGGKRSVSELFASDTATASSAAVAVDSPAAVEDEELRELLEQIESSPDDYDSYVELPSIHYANDDREQFLAWASRLQPRIDHNSAEWQQVVEMGRELMPDAAIFAGDVQADAAPGVDTVEVESALEAECGSATDATWTPPWTPDAEAEAGRPTSATVDDILSLDDDEPMIAANTESGSESAPLDISEPYVEPVRVGPAADSGLGTIDPAATSSGSYLDLDMDSEPDGRADDGGLVMPATPADSGFSAEAEAAPADDRFAPLEFDDTPLTPSADSDRGPASDAATGLKADESTGIDLPPLDLDDEDDAMPANVVDFSEALGGSDEATTKLELARAYMDMGDPDGAKAMLEEVLGEGDTAQREEARRLLDLL